MAPCIDWLRFRPAAPKEAVNELRRAVVQLNEDKEYIEEAERTMGEAPEYVSGPDLNDQVRKGLSISPELKTFMEDYVKKGREVDAQPFTGEEERPGHMTSVKVARPANSFVGSAVERIEDLRFLRGRGQYVGRRHAAGSAACGHPAQCGRARQDPRDR